MASTRGVYIYILTEREDSSWWLWWEKEEEGWRCSSRILCLLIAFSIITLSLSLSLSQNGNFVGCQIWEQRRGDQIYGITVAKGIDYSKETEKRKWSSVEYVGENALELKRKIFSERMCDCTVYAVKVPRRLLPRFSS